MTDSGLNNAEITLIKGAIQQFPEIESTLLFGSRAKGNFKSSSDVDLAIKGKLISHLTVVRLSQLLNEDLNLPYHFDVLDYNEITNPDLRGHIDRVGIEIT